MSVESPPLKPSTKARRSLGLLQVHQQRQSMQNESASATSTTTSSTSVSEDLCVASLSGSMQNLQMQVSKFIIIFC